MSNQLEPVGVIGVGWVGLVTAACFAELGHQVIARDILQEKVDSLSRGEVAVYLIRVVATAGRREVVALDEMAIQIQDSPPSKVWKALRLTHNPAV